MRWYLFVCLLALSLDELTSAPNKNTFSLEKDENYEPVKNTMDITNDEEYDGGSGSISIEGSGGGSTVTPNMVGSGEQEILLLDLRVTEINGEEARFTDDLLNNTSQYFIETEKFICEGISTVASDSMDCFVISFNKGSIIAKTQFTILPTSSLSSEEVETEIKMASRQGRVGALTVDPDSIVLKSPYTTVKMTSTSAPGVVTTGGLEPLVKLKTTMKVKQSTTNEFVFETQEMISQIIDVIPTTDDTFFTKLFQNPVILAGMVGAAVLILLTMILLSMFIVYRVRKKDEGSYSLDEPGKMKDPQAYWKDTKEFYA